MIVKLQLCVCEFLKADVAAALQEELIGDVELSTFPAHCGHPPMDWKTLALALPESVQPQNACVLGGVCLAGLNSQPAGELGGCQRVLKSICFEYLLGAQMIHWQVQTGAYLLTPGWLDSWQRRIAELGFTRETGRIFFKETVKKLVLLDTGTHPESAEKLRELAAYLDLPDETLPVGLDFLRLELRNIVARWRHDRDSRRLTESSSRACRLASDHAMASEMLSELAEIADEENVVRKIADICRSLFAPSQLKCASIDKGTLSYVQAIPDFLAIPAEFLQEVEDAEGNFGFSRMGTGFWLKLIHRQETVGWVDADGFAFPEHRKNYLNLALAMSKVFALCIVNARTFARLDETVDELRQEAAERLLMTQERERLVEELQETLGKVTTLQGLLPICAGCKKIRDDNGKWNSIEAYVQERTAARFSHGMCPDCIPIWFPGIKI
jgi:hypothetical protein